MSVRPTPSLAARGLPPGLLQAFRTAVGELGHAAAATTFVRTIAAERGDAGVEAFRDLAGRDFPVADAVAGRWLGGWRPAPATAEPLLRQLNGIVRIVVVGLEALHLDALLDACPERRIGLLTSQTLPADWDRVLANGGGRLTGLGVDDVLAWCGPDAAIVCCAYGVPDSGTCFVPQAWLRLHGPDMRPRFRALVAWHILPAPFGVYPRWLHEVPLSDFTHVVPA